MTTNLKGRAVRDDGSVVNSQTVLVEILYQGKDIGDCLIDDALEIERFKIANTLCDTNIPTPVKSDDISWTEINWLEHWLTPEQYSNIDLKEWCYARCETAEQKARVDIELEEFKKRNMTKAIIHMIYCVDTWRKHNIVWGVGRGSSVASYVLYLIGITKLDPIKYNLDLSDWLK